MSALSVGNEGVSENLILDQSTGSSVLLSLFYENNGIEQLILNPKEEHFKEAKLSSYFTLWNVTTGEVIEQHGCFPVVPTKKLQPKDDWLNALKDLFDSHNLSPKHDHKLMATWQALDVGAIDQQKATERYKEVAEELGLISANLEPTIKPKEVAKPKQMPTLTNNSFTSPQSGRTYKVFLSNGKTALSKEEILKLESVVSKDFYLNSILDDYVRNPDKYIKELREKLGRLA